MSTRRTHRLVIDGSRLEQAIERMGYASVRAFADSLGLHRNTLGNYISGRTSLPDALARIVAALDLEPGDLIRLDPPARRTPGLAIAPLIDRLVARRPDAAFALFGSRARGTAGRYSDYDVGVYAEQGLSFSDYSRLLDLVAEWNDNDKSLLSVQLVDLQNGDERFLGEIASDLVFLGGSQGSWHALQWRVGLVLHE